MNKIVLSIGVNDLSRYTDTAKIEVNDNSILNAMNLEKDLNLDIVLYENACLILNLFDCTKEVTINLNIESRSKSKFILNASFICDTKYELNIQNNLYGDDITNDVNIRGINEENGTVKIEMNGTVAGETKNNIINEYAKIINKSKNSNVLIPNLIVNTNEVVANHGVSIGGFRSEELFYLMSKGIDKKSAKEIIEEGFILSIMDEDIKNKIKNILMGR